MNRAARTLAAEVMAKEAVVIPRGLWSHQGEDKVHLFGMEGKAFSQEVLRNGANEYWGWLRPEDMGEKGDRWSLYFAYGAAGLNGQGGQILWDEAFLPKAWAGELYRHLISGDHLRAILEGAPRGEEQDTDLVVGRFVTEEEEGFWVSALEKVDVPVWPRLSRGWKGERWAGEMQMLGVLCRPGKLGNPPEWTTPLLIAWGDSRGEFLGWEAIDSMLEAREVSAGSKRILEPIEGWNRFEGKLRVDSFPREL